MSDAGPAAPPTSSRRLRLVPALLAIALPLLLLRLGAKDVWEASEGRPLESAREMKAHGDWLVQYTNGEKDLTKPPLYAWLAGVAFAIGGENEFAGRVPSVLASIGVLLAVFTLARRIAGPRAGFLSAVLLLTTAKFLWQARLAELETLLALGVTGAYVAFDAAVHVAPTDAGDGTRCPRPLVSWLAFGLSLGFAAAVKGPIAFLLVLPGAIAYAVYAKRARALRSAGFSIALLIALALGAAWPAAVVWRDGKPALDTLLSFAKGENVGHLHDPFYYLVQYPLYALPWTPLVLLAMRMRWARGLEPEAAVRARLPLIAFVATFLAQSILFAKQTHYLIPTVFPMGAVLVGCFIDRWIGGPDEVTRARAIGALVVVVLALETVAAGWVVPGSNRSQSSRAFIEDVDRHVPRSASLAWTVFGSHSDYLWHFSAERVGTTGIPELVGRDEDETVERVRAFLSREGPAYAIVTAEQAKRLADVAEDVLRDDAFQRKNRSVVLVKRKP